MHTLLTAMCIYTPPSCCNLGDFLESCGDVQAIPEKHDNSAFETSLFFPVRFEISGEKASKLV